jgi:hypothetical protein
MGIRERLRRIGDPFGRQQAKPSPAVGCGQETVGDCMRRSGPDLKSAVLRHLAVTGFAFLIGSGAAFAQSGTPAPDQTGKPPAASPADITRENQRKTDEFVEASQAISGPAGNPECVWLGRRVVGLMWRDDMDTAFRHLDLYDRFGCPGPHIQAAFRCVVRQGNNIDPKSPQTLNARVHSCWVNPTAAVATAATTPPASPAPSGSPPAAAPPAAQNSSAGTAPAGTANKEAR